MDAITFRGIEAVGFDTVDDPALLEPRDAIVRVEFAGLCGSDLHPYFGREVGIDVGTVLGHELVGEVVALGEGARARLSALPGGAPFGVGDRVVAPFTTNCGECAHCRRGLTARCERGELFGWREGGVGLDGAQAEFVRVPLADATLVPVPEALEDPGLAILAGDILSTALFGVDLAGVRPGGVVGVVGCGPVGLLAIVAARAAGAERVVAVDPVPSRVEAARRFGATAVALEPRDDPAAAARAAVDAVTSGRGADGVVEAVGSPEATRTAADLLAVGGRLAAVGVHTEPHLALSPGEMYDRNLTYAAGRCPARHYLPAALDLATREARLLDSLVTHRLPLSDGPEAYRRFGAREPGWVKVLLIP
jgi:threonine dehydrogenase-like Zn-dependent dehydrogenase